MADEPNGTRWRVDRTVTLGVIGAIVLQTSGALWWAATTNARLEEYGRRIAEAEASAKEATRAGAEVNSRLSAIEAVLKGQADTLIDIRAALWGRPQPRQQ